MAACVEALRVRDQALEPRQLVIELRTGLRVAVRQIEAGDDNAVHRSFDITALVVGGIAGQPAANLHRLAALGEDRHAVPGALTVPDGAVSGAPDFSGGEAAVERFEL